MTECYNDLFHAVDIYLEPIEKKHEYVIVFNAFTGPVSLKSSALLQSSLLSRIF